MTIAETELVLAVAEYENVSVIEFLDRLGGGPEQDQQIDLAS
jgi:hypothetical protein